MRLSRKVAVGVMAAAASMGSAAVTATPAPAATTACTYTAPLGSYHYNGVEYWLSDSVCNGTEIARGAANDASASGATAQDYWFLWIYNADSGVTKSAWEPPSNSSNKYTATLSNVGPGTGSHVCIQPYLYEGAPPAAGKQCTPYYSG
jgi:hypothetical protein